MSFEVGEEETTVFLPLLYLYVAVVWHKASGFQKMCRTVSDMYCFVVVVKFTKKRTESSTLAQRQHESIIQYMLMTKDQTVCRHTDMLWSRDLELNLLFHRHFSSNQKELGSLRTDTVIL